MLRFTKSKIKFNMINRFSLLLLLAFFSLGAVQAQGLGGAFNKLKSKVLGEDNADIGNGLKEALNNGVGEAVDFLSTEDGYYKSVYKILLPEEARKVVDKLKIVPGFADVEANLIEKINRAAESAAQKAGPIFLDAIKQMTFKDALDLLMGEKDAATRYLEKTTYQSLYDEFKPVIITALDEVNAREYWREATSAYNKIPLTKKVNTELDDHVTQNALTGMFSLVEKKEADIRENPAARTSELLQNVFAKQDKK